ncbi:hypothetical protein M9H77_12249 [Catharanthus roseus]|uniref:Uncharacterized protein n=1 Tax=Catharanthus roseus TaxID=4058 RepID=A0ACC0BGU0_CATRO|nr:hypothetical protein M9H77_12249 [Catharanthus roseus]
MVQAADKTTFPSTIKEELQTNPFIRMNLLEVQELRIRGYQKKKWMQSSNFSVKSAVSGLNRGLADNEDVAKDLDSVTGPVDLSADLLILEKILQYRTAFSVLLDAIRL